MMRAAKLEPLEPYPGGDHLPWRCECVVCGAIGAPTRANIGRGQGGCIDCGIKANAAMRLGDADQAVVDMVRAMQPLDPYPGSNNPRRCRCLRCEQEVNPRLAHIRRGRGGCFDCGVAENGLRQRTPPRAAEAQLREGGFAPLEPYPGLTSRPGRCRCLTCGKIIKAALTKVRAGIGVPAGRRLASQHPIVLTDDESRMTASADLVEFTDSGEPAAVYDAKYKPWVTHLQLATCTKS